MRPSVFVLSVLSGFAGAGALSAQAPAPISPDDFAVAGLTADTDSAAIRAAFGVPDSIVVRDNPLDSGGGLPTWYYQDLTVFFGYAPTPFGFLISGPQYETHRGLRVGHSGEEARALYGEPQFAWEDSLIFTDPADIEGLHVIRTDLESGVVYRIYVGWLLD